MKIMDCNVMAILIKKVIALLMVTCRRLIISAKMVCEVCCYVEGCYNCAVCSTWYVWTEEHSLDGNTCIVCNHEAEEPEEPSPETARSSRQISDHILID